MYLKSEIAMNQLNPPADILLKKYRVRHVVHVNGRRYDVTWHSADGIQNYYLEIRGEREMINPHTVSSVHPEIRTVSTDVDPCGRLGKKILAALNLTPANFGYQ